MNVHTIVDARLVDDPREFETKDGKSLLSIRVADNVLGGDKKFETMFVSAVLNEGLARVVRERGLAKGDIVTITGDLRIRTYERKGKGKKGGGEGISYEIPFVQSFRIQKCAADDAPDEPEEEPEETGPVADTPDGTIDDDPFES